MDVNFMQEQLPLYVEAAKLTLHMAVWGILFSILTGLICSMIRYLKIPILRQLVACYIELSRNTPLLIQLFFCTLVCLSWELCSAPRAVPS